MVEKLNLPRAWLALLLMFSVLLAGCAGVTPGVSLQEQIDALMNDGRQFYANKNYDAAIAKFGEVVAKAYWESGERGNALDAFRKVLEIDPRQTEALRFLLLGR